MLEPSKDLLTRKLGPMPTWAWMLIGLGLAVIYKTFVANKKNSDAKNAENPTGADDPSSVSLIGGDQTPPVVFQNYTTFTGSYVPPGGGRMTPPVAPPAVTVPGATGGTAATPTPATTSAKPAATTPNGHWVTVAKFTTKNPPWNSTLSGIAKQLKGNSNAWQAIWNAPQNAAEKTRRKDPKHIQPGDKIFVPA